jgi:hypothetical protein
MNVFEVYFNQNFEFSLHKNPGGRGVFATNWLAFWKVWGRDGGVYRDVLAKVQAEGKIVGNLVGIDESIRGNLTLCDEFEFEDLLYVIWIFL